MEKSTIKGNMFNANSYSTAFTQAFEDFLPILNLLNQLQGLKN